MRAMVFLSLILVASVSSVSAEERVQDAKAWRPMIVTDLRFPGAAGEFYAGLWRDRIAVNLAALRKLNPTTPVIGNGLVAEAHIVVRNEEAVAVVSILHAQNLCKPLPDSKAGSAVVRKCPLRLAVFRNGRSEVREGEGCFVVSPPTGVGVKDGARGGVAYASYDVETRSIRLGVIVDQRLVEPCSQSISIREVMQ